jgi:MFS transporter, DHA1 family, tetracycline resistance protein
MKRNAAIPFIMLSTVLDVLGIGLIIPVVPILVGELTHDRHAQVMWYLAFVIAFGVAQFLCAPLLGALSDRYGRRPILLLGIAGLGLTFLVTGLTESLYVMVGVRVLSGAMSANFAVAQAYVADITSREDRTSALGKIGAMFGVGFVLGPVLGGVLGHVSLRLPLFVAAGMCALNWFYGLLILPESLPPERRDRLAALHINPFASLRGLAQLRGVGSLVLAIVAANLAQFMLQIVWVLYTNFRFHWGPLQSGLSLCVVGVVAVVVQGGLLKRLLAVMGERKLVVAGLLSGAFAYAGYGLVTQGWMLYFVIIANFLAFASSVALQGIVSKAADAREQGRTMASLTALLSLASIAAPIFGTMLLDRVAELPTNDPWMGAPFFACSLIEFSAYLIALRYFAQHREQSAIAVPGASA